MKPTNINLGTFYNLDRRTIASYKNSKDIRIRNHYQALLEYFIKETKWKQITK